MPVGQRGRVVAVEHGPTGKTDEPEDSAEGGSLRAFIRRFAVETFDPKRRGEEAIWARSKSGLETEFFGERELMERKPRAPAMSKEAMRQESERLVREAMARNMTITQGKTRLDVKCGRCGAPNRVSAEVDHGRVEYACKECGHKQTTL
jgi:hypothetical protein